MKTRALVAMTTGALALTAVAVPAAHADDRPTGAVAPFAAQAAAPAPLGSIVSGLKLSGGKDLVVGTSAKKLTVTFTAKHSKGIKDAIAFLWRGSDVNAADRMLTPPLMGAAGDFCKKVNRTTSTCTVAIVADPKFPIDEFRLDNANAGSWKLAVAVLAGNDKEYGDEKYRTHSVKRAAKLTVNASPEPVRRGATVTVKGDLTRANWDTHRYAGFASGAVKLQFKKPGGTWKTVKTVAADSRGKVKTTVKASADGSYRFTYGGSSKTAGVTSSADFIDVR
ncbi:calcium-binding protein [Streptomyces sp. JNUCC 64]